MEKTSIGIWNIDMDKRLSLMVIHLNMASMFIMYIIHHIVQTHLESLSYYFDYTTTNKVMKRVINCHSLFDLCIIFTFTFIKSLHDYCYMGGGGGIFMNY